jgi:pimeloyl-ACP methyl ester carboxylesterase
MLLTMARSDRTSTVVLVHGAWHGAWCWDKVVARLDAAGVPSVAIDLPLTSLADDVAATQRAIDAAGGPVVLTGHSYGGVVISEAGNHPAVQHLVFVCALAVDSGRSAAHAVEVDLPSTDLGDALQFADDGTVTLEPSSIEPAFYADCDRADVDAAIARLRPIALRCMTDTVTTASWHTVPSTYAVCTQDAAIHPALQRVLAEQCTNTVEWPTSHSPFLSQPQLVSDVLIGLTSS